MKNDVQSFCFEVDCLRSEIISTRDNLLLSNLVGLQLDIVDKLISRI